MDEIALRRIKADDMKTADKLANDRSVALPALEANQFERLVSLDRPAGIFDQGVYSMGRDTIYVMRPPQVGDAIISPGPDGPTRETG